jgi:hypothetical protein
MVALAACGSPSQRLVDGVFDAGDGAVDAGPNHPPLPDAGAISDAAPVDGALTDAPPADAPYADTPPADAPPAAPPLATLTVTNAGDRAGSVTSDDGALACPPACAASRPVGTQLTLRASPSAGAIFVGWEGACHGVRRAASR